jgi:glyoxylase-like metal-dependent hydrolase (beta-lactamase superfamily II)
MLTQIRDDLWETQGESPFPHLTTHAYLWTGATGGNVLFYSTVTDQDFDEIERLGGVAHQYLSHHDEAGPTVRAARARFGARLHAGRGDHRQISRFSDDVTWIDTRSVDDTGVEVLPTPGHTPGSSCYLAQGVAGEQYLFVGDTIYVDNDGRWKAGNLGFSDARALAASLELLATLHPDLVISSAAPTGVAVHDMHDPVVTWTSTINAALASLQR